MAVVSNAKAASNNDVRTERQRNANDRMGCRPERAGDCPALNFRWPHAQVRGWWRWLFHGERNEAKIQPRSACVTDCRNGRRERSGSARTPDARDTSNQWFRSRCNRLGLASRTSVVHPQRKPSGARAMLIVSA